MQAEGTTDFVSIGRKLLVSTVLKRINSEIPFDVRTQHTSIIARNKDIALCTGRAAVGVGVDAGGAGEGARLAGAVGGHEVAREAVETVGTVAGHAAHAVGGGVAGLAPVVGSEVEAGQADGAQGGVGTGAVVAAGVAGSRGIGGGA